MNRNIIIRACPDGGTCHHRCGPTGPCYRVGCCGPLSGVFGGDEWPSWLRSDPWWVTRAGARWAGPFTRATARDVATLLNTVAPRPHFAAEQQPDNVPAACALCGASPLPPIGTGHPHRCPTT